MNAPAVGTRYAWYVVTVLLLLNVSSFIDRQVMALLVTQLNENLTDRKLKIALTPEVVDWIIEVTCKDRSYGARPLRRAIQRYVEDPLSEELIRGHLRGGDIEVYLDSGTLAYRPAGELETGRKLA